MNGARIENGWTPEFLVPEPGRFDLRTTSLTADMIASMDDGGSIEIFTPDPNIGVQSTVRLTMDGFSGAYATLRKACDAAQSANAGFPSPGLILPPGPGDAAVAERDPEREFQLRLPGRRYAPALPDSPAAWPDDAAAATQPDDAAVEPLTKASDRQAPPFTAARRCRSDSCRSRTPEEHVSRASGG